MRRWLLLVLLALLPLRGWVGEVMAGEMLAQQLAAAAGQQAHEAARHHAALAAAHDCVEHAPHGAQPHDAHHGAQPQAHHAASATDDHGQPTAQWDGDCPTCASCQVCSSVALDLAPPALPLVSLAHAPPASAVPHFASAEPRLGDEPPVS